MIDDDRKPDREANERPPEQSPETSSEQASQKTRRDFLKTGLAAAAAGGVAGAAGAQDGGTSVRYMPEEHWRERMKAPDDGKKYGWVVDTRRCFGCHGCEVACKAENDVPLGNYIRQTIYTDFERPTTGAVARIMVPMACQHCEDAPCLKACPCGALHKGPGGSVQIDYDSCSGHAACKEACPYGAIYIDPVANQAVKCHNCTHRLELDLEPPCVSTCPSEALYFGDLNDPESKISKFKARIESEDDADLEVLRAEKQTKPRAQFVVDANHPMKAWEKRIPREGESYANDAYSVFEWGDFEKGKDE